jgi:hypothetical protein
VQQRIQALTRIYSSDTAMAMGMMVALQLVGLLAVVNLIHAVAPGV